MKKNTLLLLLVIIFGAFFVGSCAVSSADGEGAVVVDIPDADGDGIPDGTVSAASGTELVRVYLKSGQNSLLQMPSGLMYVEEPAAVGSVSVPGVPSGEWDVLLAYGVVSGSAFIVTSYGSSGPTFVAPGIENPVNITLKETPMDISTALAGKNITGLVSLGADVYVSAGQSLYKGTDLAGLALDTPAFTGTLRSIDKGLSLAGVPEVWLNTSDGIQSYSYSPSLAITSTEVPVIRSGALLSGTDILSFYQTTQGFAGATVSLNSSSITWHRVDDFTEYFKSQLVRDFVLTSDYFYCVTPFGALTMDKAIYTNLNANPDASMDFFADGSFFSVMEGVEKIPIVSLGYDSVNGVMYVGTAKGAYTATIGADGLPAADPVIIPGTEGLTVAKIAVNANKWAAFATPLSVLLLDGTADSLYELPFTAGIPGETIEMRWKEGAPNVLYIAGKNSPLSSGGFVAVDMVSKDNFVQLR